MRSIDTRIPSPKPATFRLTCIAALLALATACTSPPRPPDEPSAARAEAAPEAAPVTEPARGQFAIPGSKIDTWNAVGQIVVRLDGVTYEGRSQMLGIYAVRYQGEQFLIVTRARVMQGATDGMVTEVGALRPDGAPNDSVASSELLRLLEQRLPAELARIEAGERD